MKILFLAPLTREITPRITAARPRIIFDLICGLKKRGHKITVLGTGNSYIPGVKIVPIIKTGFYGLSSSFENPFYTHTSFLVKLAKKAEAMSSDFDIIHNHAYPESINLLVEPNCKAPIITTIHTQITPEYDEALSLFPHSYLICISKAAKNLARKANIYKVIYNGTDTSLYRFCAKKDNYLLWIGRLSRAKDKNGNFMDPKGVRWAIKLAKETDSRLFLAGNVEDPAFFEKDVKPHLNKKIKWIGSISPEQSLTKKGVVKLMQRARVFLMTVNWNEPFGLVMAEAQSCGTPVIGFNRGSIGELVVNGKTGFVVNPKEGLEGLKKTLKKIDKINPEDCRKHIEKKFSLDKMVENYEKTYKEIIKKK